MLDKRYAAHWERQSAPHHHCISSPSLLGLCVHLGQRQRNTKNAAFRAPKHANKVRIELGLVTEGIHDAEGFGLQMKYK